ncbi:MAG: Bifunctional ligase/repressor BirA [Chlamydiae bacterium]|nr:Bifunctional ligase/repressor BirA [Chlamydiota bacterium]
MEENVKHIHFKEIDSTNNWAKKNCRSLDLSQITRITADEQTSGRGRFNRKWLSPKDLNIYLTYLFAIDRDTIDPANLAQLLSLSIASLLDQEGVTPQIKWPNDVLIDGKKIAGLLCETTDLAIILGAGINVNMGKELLDTIDQPATSLLVETGKSHSIEKLIKSLELLFLQDLRLYRKEGFPPFFKRYDALLTHKGQTITLKQNGSSVTGTLHSLNPDGRLNLLLPSGEIQTISSGEIQP